jgi:hypothetical protein
VHARCGVGLSCEGNAADLAPGYPDRSVGLGREGERLGLPLADRAGNVCRGGEVERSRLEDAERGVELDGRKDPELLG